MSIDRIRTSEDRNGNDTSLEGQMLIAMPGMGDPRFERSLIYLCAHSSSGAMGIRVNRESQRVKFPELLVQLEVIGSEEAIRLPSPAADVQVLRGGPVDRGRGFVLHSPDFFTPSSSLAISDNIALTATVDILRAIAKGEGPKKSVLALGYAGWAEGQLEGEIQKNGWLTCPADESLIFDSNHETKYERALKKIGVDLSMLSAQMGRA
jgi:putative transcriptional regulator